MNNNLLNGLSRTGEDLDISLMKIKMAMELIEDFQRDLYNKSIHMQELSDAWSLLNKAREKYIK